jgi:hypothetical protein
MPDPTNRAHIVQSVVSGAEARLERGGGSCPEFERLHLVDLSHGGIHQRTDIVFPVCVDRALCNGGARESVNRVETAILGQQVEINKSGGLQMRQGGLYGTPDGSAGRLARIEHVEQNDEWARFLALIQAHGNVCWGEPLSKTAKSEAVKFGTGFPAESGDYLDHESRRVAGAGLRMDRNTAGCQ